MNKRPKPKKHILKRLSFYPLKPEEAIAAFMGVDLMKIKMAESPALPKA
jgi:hypothetical protein